MAVRKSKAPVVLNTQFRVFLAIASLVSGFYDEPMAIHSSPSANNPIRKKVRNVVPQHYGQTVPTDVVFVVIDRGISRVEPDGTSLQNYANADVMRRAFEWCLAARIDASQISITTFYRGQKNLLQGGQIKASTVREFGTMDAYRRELLS